MPVQRFPAIGTMAVIALVALSACGSSAPVKVGFIGSLGGEVSQLAIEGRNGTELAIETVNARGGRRYELVLHDEPSRDNDGRGAIDAAARAGDAFAIGPMGSTGAPLLMAKARQARLVLISPTANSELLAGHDDYFFRAAPASAGGAEQLARAAIARGLRSAALMIEERNGDYTEGFAQAFTRRFQALGGTEVAAVRYKTDQSPDFAALAAELLARHPRFVMLVCGPVDAAIVAQQLRRRDADAKLALSTWGVSDQVLQLGGRALDGALALQDFDLDGRQPRYLEVLARFKARYGMAPGAAALSAYQATLMAIEALEKTPPGQSLRDVLGGPGTWPGLQGPLEFDRFGDSTAHFHLSEVRDGHFVMLAS